MTQAGKPGQVLGVTVTLASYPPERRSDVARALEEISPSSGPSLGALPMRVLDTPSPDEAERAYDLLDAAGATVSITREWMDPDAETARRRCPSCGSENTQPFAYAGPGGRVNRKCERCGHLFKARSEGLLGSVGGVTPPRDA